MQAGAWTCRYCSCMLERGLHYRWTSRCAATGSDWGTKRQDKRKRPGEMQRVQRSNRPPGWQGQPRREPSGADDWLPPDQGSVTGWEVALRSKGQPGSQSDGSHVRQSQQRQGHQAADTLPAAQGRNGSNARGRDRWGNGQRNAWQQHEQQQSRGQGSQGSPVSGQRSGWQQQGQGWRAPPQRAGRAWQEERDAEPSAVQRLRDAWQGDVVYGFSPVLAALVAQRRTLHALHVQAGLEPSLGKSRAALQRILRLAQEQGVPVMPETGKHELNMLCEQRPHQGVVLDASELLFEPLKHLPDAAEAASAHAASRQAGTATSQHPIWLALDEVTDPHNFGAALRSAYFLGAAGVLSCSRNSAPLSGIVSKASAGALEASPVFTASNLPATLQSATDNGWQVLGAAADPQAVSCVGFRPSGPTVLVIGNEGSGLRTTVKRSCSQLVNIPGGRHDDPADVDSLNLSVATGILLHILLTE